MSAQEIVHVLVELVRDGDSSFERLHGADALNLAQEIEATWMAQMEENLSYVLLWEQFLSTSEEVAPALVGVVRKLMGADPTLAQWSKESIERYSQMAGQHAGDRTGEG